MAVRPASYYEQIFKDLNLDVIYFEDYESYKANETTTINEERVWLLKESPHSPWYRLGLQSLTEASDEKEQVTNEF